MAIERIFYCDWRECNTHIQTARTRPQAGFVTVMEDAGPSLHFCSWDCVLRHAAEKPPVEVVLPAGDD